jgi:hypothetical protein
VDPLPCSTIVYRTITRRRDFQGGRPLANAFLLRPTDTDGLSVDYNVAVPDGCAPHLSGRKAVVSLHVGRLRDLGLDVVPDSPTHANVVGLSRRDQDLLKAEQMAAKLAEIARPVWVE